MARAAPAIVCSTLVAVLAGCGPEVPAEPSWQADVYPIVQARCIRCHREPLGADSLVGRITIGDFDRASVDELMTYASIFAALAPTLIRSDRADRMPPPPYARLDDWQIDTIVRWADHPR